MNAETKRHIDAARQVLVGVVPNPTSQIDQITNALIYKFMDDMDQSAIKSGGEASFFTGDLERYAWTRLMDTRVGNQERMNLYSEALVKFSESKQLPELFRNIFKSAYLPYRSPDVLGLFLKEIDYFNYSHPEELGNAYEYLLSIMSSQGDAGQFRTPRHIIDFIVEAVNPTKDDKVLDPACGTGGFLISAYKNILKQHDGKDDPKKKEKPLTPDQRRTLMQNFEGYDIDPGMVRIAQVNMYLHQFKNPKIVQYDSLSMDERWNDKFDVILANPPFMSPKGGVSTHNKFGIQSTRSEVLFVDYIMNHLRPKGRAGIIVPEGIIFQSGAAYQQLRKNLVNDGLYAVVSLPSGVFQPYSSVKTSILFFDNEISKKASDVLFVKINNDGFELGAQRRPLKTSHIPAAIEILRLYKQRVLEGGKITFQSDDEFAVLVPKEKIAKDNDYNLSGDRYRATSDFTSTKYPMVRIDEVCEILSGGGFPVDEQGATNGDIPFLKVSDMNLPGNEIWINHANNFVNKETLKKLKVKTAPKGTIIFPKIGAAIATNKKRILSRESAYDNNVMGLIPNEKINPSFLFYLLKQLNLSDWASASALPSIRKSDVEKYLITLPPLEVQKEIVEQIEVRQKAIQGAREVIKNLERERRYFGQSLKKLNYQMTDMANIFNKVSDQINPQQYDYEVVYIGLENIESNSGVLVGDIKSNTKSIKSIKGAFKKGDILYGKLRPNLNKVWFANCDGICSTDILILRPTSKEISSKVYSLILQSDEFNREVLNGIKGAQLPRVSFDYISKIKIPVIPYEDQNKFISEMETEEKVIELNKKIIEILENKISVTLSEI